MHRWKTTRGGSLIAVGVDTKFTGWRADLMVLDDLQSDELSAHERDQLWKWYESSRFSASNLELRSRGCNSAGRGRPSGRAIAAADGGDWENVRLPALAEKKRTESALAGRVLVARTSVREGA